MDIDVRSFHLVNVTDTCSVSNILSSKLFYTAANNAKCHFCITGYVYYELVHKPRNKTPESKELINRLLKAQEQEKFITHELTIEDLQQIEILKRRKNLGRGELSSIAFAMRIRQAFLTDDQPARRQAKEMIPLHLVQTTPHLLGWLIFTQKIGDSEVAQIIDECKVYQKSFDKILKPHFEHAYHEGLRCKLTKSQFSVEAG